MSKKAPDLGSGATPPPRPERRGRGRPRLADIGVRRQGRARLLNALTTNPVNGFLSHRDFLQKLYDDVKADHPSYSYFQLAEDLGFSRSNVLWLVITGRRRLTQRAAARIAAALQLTADARKYFTVLVLYGNARRSDEREALFRELIALKGRGLETSTSQLILEYYSEWHHPIMRELVGLDGYSSDPDWINRRLVTRLSPMQIHRSLQLLEKLGLIAYDHKRGAHVQTKGQILPDRLVERLASVRFHQKMCDAARDAVTRIPARRREMNSLTLCLSDDVAMKVGEILYKACEEIMHLESQVKQRSQVFQVNVHLFPFTKNAEDPS